jgi:hypothetical protein
MTTSAAPIAATQSAGLRLPPWAYLGIIFGLVGAASIALWGPIGVSGTYPRFIGAILGVFSPEYAAANPYLTKMGSLVRGETFLVLGLVIGGFLGMKRDGKAAPKVEMVHAGDRTVAVRYREAFLGGFLIVFGARIAGGCTSGLIISGMTQLSVSGFVFAFGVFAAGIGTAKVLEARRAGGN